ncbi:glycoside hydrolase family 30 protein [Microbacterium gorillae]|uniref:glycoside hydrolase family 30 protein n=1 Tax=Microbacterium gorillae TaxID=1231063 RepID=UPI0006942B81|nr:glycoside hydrolase [Microbacterium gorillae]
MPIRPTRPHRQPTTPRPTRARAITASIGVAVLAASLIPAAPASAADPVVTIDWSSTQQAIDGFGASGAFQQAAGIQAMPEPQRSQILELLFSRTAGAGLSIVRNDIGDGGTWSDAAGGPHGTILPSDPGTGTPVYDWTKDDDQVWLMKEAQKRGVQTFFSTAWSPPAWMKTNNSVENGGALRADKYQAYADYLAAYIKGYREQHGLTISAVSFTNEPNHSFSYSSSDWTAENVRDFVKVLGPTLTTAGVSADIIAAEEASASDALVAKTLEDPAARAELDITGFHGYASGPVGQEPSRLANKRLWLTETSYMNVTDASINAGLDWAGRMYDFLSTNVNAVNYWWLATVKQQGGEGLITLHPATNTFTPTKRLFTMGNWSRFVRPGWVRVAATVPAAVTNAQVKLTAFRSPGTGEFAQVAINSSNVPVTFDLALGGGTTALTPYRTSATESLAQLPDIPVAGGTATVTLAPRSVTTFTGSGAPASSGQGTLIADDTDTRGGNAQYSFSGGWSRNANQPAAYNGGDTYSKVAGKSYRVTFVGTKAVIHGVNAPSAGIAAVSVDGGPETLVDLYATSRTDDVPIFSTGDLPLGQHSVRVRVTGTKNASSSDTWVTADRAVVTTQGPTIVNDTATGTGLKQVEYRGDWSSWWRENGAFRKDNHYSKTEGASMVFRFANQARLFAATGPNAGLASISVDDGPEKIVDLYSAERIDGQQLISTPWLPSGKHTITVTVLGKKNAAATDSYVSIDRFDAY